MHKSFEIFVKSTYKNDNKLKELESLLKNESYLPKEDIFEVFNMNLYKIKIVVLGESPTSDPTTSTPYSFLPKDKEIQDFWINKNILFLNVSLTIFTGSMFSHEYYWEQFIKKVIKYISHENPCIWVMPKTLKYANSLYSRIIINKEADIIKSRGDRNYIINSTNFYNELHLKEKAINNDNFEVINKILNKQRKKIIT